MSTRRELRLATAATVAIALAALVGPLRTGDHTASANRGGQPPPGSGTVTYQRPQITRSPGGQSAESIQLASEQVAATSGVFHPLTPCRLVDTRYMTGVGGQPLLPFTPRSFVVYATNLAPQGGLNGNCGVPPTVTAVSINVTSANQPGTGNGYITAYPVNATAPTASLVNFKPGINVANAATIAICRNGLLLCYSDLMFVASAQTHLIVDVMGYYEYPLTAQVNADGTLAGTSPAVVSATKYGAGAYEIVFDRDISQCVPQATLGNSGGGSVGGAEIESDDRIGNANAVFVGTTNSTGTDTDFPFQLLITC